MIDLTEHIGRCLVYLEPVSQSMIWWNCHDKLFLQVQGVVKEFPCPALTVRQATGIAQIIASDNIQEPLNIFEMVELENEIDALDLSDLVLEDNNHAR